MSIDIWSIGLHAAPTTSCRFFARCDSVGALSVTINGQTFTSSSDADPAIDDGTIIVDATGLSADTAYPFTLTQDGDTKTGTVKTAPSSTDSVFEFAVTSCQDLGDNKPTAFGIIGHYGDPRFIVGLGDFFYISTTSPVNGESMTNITTGVAAATTIANYTQRWRAAMRNSEFKLARSIPYCQVPDDHEYAGDDWDHEIYRVTTWGTANSVAGVTTQAQVDDIWNAGNTAASYYLKGNPDNVDSPTADIPSNSAEITANNYPVRYTSWVAGSCLFLLCDCISGRSACKDTDDASKLMFGANQEAWLLSKLQNTTATFACIMQQKKTRRNTGGDNTDGWFVSTTPNSPTDNNKGYTTQLNRITDAIKAKSGYANPNLTVVWFSGDTHIGNVIEDVSEEHICINGCPTGAGPVSPATREYGADIAYLGPRSQDIANNNESQVFNYSRVKVHGTDKLEIWLQGIDRILWHGTVTAGQNAIDNPVGAVSL